MIESVYTLVGPWLGQDTATYRYREPERVARPSAVERLRAVCMASPDRAWFALGFAAGVAAVTAGWLR